MEPTKLEIANGVLEHLDADLINSSLNDIKDFIKPNLEGKPLTSKEAFEILDKVNDLKRTVSLMAHALRTKEEHS